MNCSGHLLLRIDNAFPCKVTRKINRFIVEATSPNREILLVHNTNTGRLNDILFPGNTIYCAPRNRPGKTTHYIVGSSVYGGSLINTRIQEKAFQVSVENHLIPWLNECRISKYQPHVGNSRFDVELDCKDDSVILELKSAVLKGSHGEAMYPDCPTIRGRRHIYELAKLSREGYKTGIVFIAGFPNATYFTPYNKGDPVIRKVLIKAAGDGVIVKSIGLCVELKNDSVFVRLYNSNIPVRIFN
ncbi:MAG: DNA/RNA nuclease SfsA [Desulfurococcales archaeon]|nr:DNA/RNA nuclease SfsA [Desulfurococcales archaeon]